MDVSCLVFSFFVHSFFYIWFLSVLWVPFPSFHSDAPWGVYIYISQPYLSQTTNLWQSSLWQGREDPTSCRKHPAAIQSTSTCHSHSNGYIGKSSVSGQACIPPDSHWSLSYSFWWRSYTVPGREFSSPLSTLHLHFLKGTLGVKRST